MRVWREDCQRSLAAILNTSETSINGLLPLVPADYRPLLSALVQENNELLARAHQRARQNHIILSRSLELMRQLLGTLSGAAAPLYTEAGVLSSTPVPGRCLDTAIA